MYKSYLGIIYYFIKFLIYIILLKQGIKQEIAKKISKNIRDQIKKINVSINGETLRVASKSKNDLQLAIKLISQLEESLNIPLKANNFR